MTSAPPATKPRFYTTLYFRVLVAITIGVVLGMVAPSVGESMEPLGSGFIKLVKMTIAPLIFCTVVVGIASMSSMKSVGKAGGLALLYFEVMSTLALIIGLVIVNVVKPGAGMHRVMTAADASVVAHLPGAGKMHTITDFLLDIIPDSFVGGFVHGDLLPVLLLAILFGFALHGLGERGGPVLDLVDRFGHVMFGIIGIIMKLAPIGAFGAMAFGIGTSEVEHVLATQTLPLKPFKTLAIEVEGDLPVGVTAKDLILAVIARIGTGGGQGYVLEYRGQAVRALSMEARMTVCNMSIEAGARAGLIAPDQTTFDYLEGREHAPKDADWDAAVAYWRTLVTDDDATFDKVVTIDASALAPFVTWGTNPGQGVPLTASVPSPDDYTDPTDRAAAERALEYMGLTAGTRT